MDKQLDSKELETMREVFIADTRVKRAFGGGKSRGKSKGRGKGKRKGSSKGKGKGAGRRRWGPRRGPKRAQSRTRGYADNKPGKKSSTKRCLISRTI